MNHGGRPTRLTASQETAANAFSQALRHSPIPDGELARHAGMYMDRMAWADYLYMAELYKKILGVHGVVAEFGVRYGKNLSLFTCLRSVFEPYNHTRVILGFDTFTGFPTVTKEDGKDEGVGKGVLSVVDGWEVQLEKLLDQHEAVSPIPHIRKFHLVKGDVNDTLDQYLHDHPETVFAMVYLDMDLYQPTKHVLEKIRDRLTKGSLIGFDEVCYSKYPGETLAVMEALGLRNIQLQRFPWAATQSYCIVE